MIKIYKHLVNCLLLLIAVGIIYPSTSVAHSWMAPKDEANKINPIASSDISTATGKTLFLENCEYCHGEQAQGLSKESAGLSKDTPNLVQRLRTHTDGDFHWKIRTGKSEMPPFKDELSDEDIWNIINYLKTISN